MNSQIKVLYIIPSLGKGGAERLLLDLCKELLKRPEIQFQLLVLDSTNAYRELYPEIQINQIHCDLKMSLFSGVQFNVEELEFIIQSFQPTIIHSHIFYADLISRLKTNKNITYISHIHGRTTQLESFPVAGFFAKGSYTNEFERRFFMKQCDKVGNNFLTVSQAYSRYLNERCKISKEKIRVIPNAIDLGRFKAKHKEKEEIMGHRFRLISIGRLETNKNQTLLLKVMDILKKKGLHLSLTILGEGSLRQNLVDQINKLDLQEEVALMGNVDNPEYYLQNSDLYIHSSMNESFGLVLIEAMACGLPVITTDGGGNAELINVGINGFIAEQNNPDNFANLVEKMIVNNDMRLNMSQNAIQFAENYSIQGYANEIINYYNSLLNE